MDNEAKSHSCSCFECVQMYGLDNPQEELDMSINKAILNKLIELGYVPDHYTEWDFNIACGNDYIIVQRALFDVCGDKYDLLIRGNILTIFERNKMQYAEDPDAIIHQGDTSPESFRAAFCKITNITGE